MARCGVAGTARAGIIAVTAGDPAGVGPEVAAAALASGQLDPDFEYRLIAPECRATLGEPTAETARAAWDGLETVAGAVIGGDVAAVVTGPVCKASLYRIGFQYPGQTEFFAARCNTASFAMLLTGGSLTVALVSTHLPLLDAVDQLSRAEIVRVGNLLADFLGTRLRRPARIAVAGLNPHAGEDGSLGREEIERIAPAIAELRAAGSAYGTTFHGPIPPDTVFYQAVAGEWDAVLCMYHDQGLIPLKLHAFHEGVNVTLGLPIVRTSPDHGTAFALAGKNRAHPGSMIAALRLAAELVKKRRANSTEPTPPTP